MYTKQMGLTLSPISFSISLVIWGNILSMLVNFRINVHIKSYVCRIDMHTRVGD